MQQVIINGEEYALPSDVRQISYEDILGLSGKQAGVSVVVIYPITVDKRDRALASGESAAVVNGMRITAIYTGSA